jgi:HD-like signal output (HDOD) protein
MDIHRQDIAGMVERMPPFPRSAHRVIELTSDINANPKELVEVIEHDPVLLLKLLRMVNSPYFGLSQKITSVNHAVLYIGINTVKNLALSAAAIGALPKTNEAGFDLNAFLTHSLATGTISRLFAKKMKVAEKDTFDYFLSGLLHDFGKIVFAHFMPQEFKKALLLAGEKKMPLYEAENEIFRIDHAQVGSLLGEKWQLPPNLIESLKGHHIQDNESGLSRITLIVSAADQITKELNIGNSGSNIIEKLPDEVVTAFGSDTTAIVGSLGDVQAEVEKAMTFISGE